MDNKYGTPLLIKYSAANSFHINELNDGKPSLVIENVDTQITRSTCFPLLFCSASTFIASRRIHILDRRASPSSSVPPPPSLHRGVSVTRHRECGYAAMQ